MDTEREDGAVTMTGALAPCNKQPLFTVLSIVHLTDDRFHWKQESGRTIFNQGLHKRFVKWNFDGMAILG